VAYWLGERRDGWRWEGGWERYKTDYATPVPNTIPIVIMFLNTVYTQLYMSFKYLEHEADVGLEAEGSTLEEAFCEGAKATFNIMVDLKEVSPKKQIKVHAESDSIPGLFIQWLNELLSLADMEGMFFSEFRVEKIKSASGRYILDGAASGEEIDPKKHKLKTEAKAATYSGLRYEIRDNKHYLRCVVDV
jgi:SHS2 domain-containing protein